MGCESSTGRCRGPPTESKCHHLCPVSYNPATCSNALRPMYSWGQCTHSVTQDENQESPGSPVPFPFTPHTWPPPELLPPNVSQDPCAVMSQHGSQSLPRPLHQLPSLLPLVLPLPRSPRGQRGLPQWQMAATAAMMGSVSSAWFARPCHPRDPRPLNSAPA